MHGYNSKQLHILRICILVKKIVEQVEKSFLQNDWCRDGGVVLKYEK